MRTLKELICGKAEEKPEEKPDIEEVLDAVLGPRDPNLHDQKLFDPVGKI